jgi:mannuronan 5-epimerase
MTSRSTLAAAAGALTVLFGSVLATGQSNYAETATTTSSMSTVTVAPSKAAPDVDTSFLESFGPREYTVEVGRWGIPTDGTQATLTTERLQRAVDWASVHGFGVVRIPKGVYLLGRKVSPDDVDGLRVPSDMDVRLAAATVFRMVPNDAWNSCLLTISGQRNVRVSGGVFEGDKDTHTYTPRASDGSTAHDEGHGICIWSQSAGVVVERVTMRGFTGDGILVHGGGTTGMTRNILIRDSEISACRRQGVSVVRGQNVVIEGNYIHDIAGVEPQFGIDFETPKGQATSRNVRVTRNRLENNAGGHIVNFDATNMWIEGNTLSQAAGKSQIDGPIILHNHTDGVILDNHITMTDRTVNGRIGILTYSDGVPVASGPSTTVSNNSCANCAIVLRDMAPSRVEGNIVENGHITLQRISVVLDANVVTQTTRAGYSFDRVTGSANANRLNGAAYGIGLSAKPFTANWYG